MKLNAFITTIIVILVILQVQPLTSNAEQPLINYMDDNQYAEKNDTEKLSNPKFQATASDESELIAALKKMLEQYDKTGSISYTGNVEDLNDGVNRALKQLFLQYPYIEGTFGSADTTYTQNSSSVIIDLSIDYLTTAEQEHYVTAQVKAIHKMIIQPGMSDFDKVRAINDYIVLKAEYTEDTKTSPHVPYTLLVEGKGVCQAYALLAYRLLEEAGIESRYVTGYVGQEKHAWNLVKLSNEWYHLDTTWNDPVFDSSIFKQHVGYQYFLVSDEQILKDHSIDERGYPKATNKKYDAFGEMSTFLYATDNYYVRRPSFVGDYVYYLGKSGRTVDTKLYVANLRDPKLNFREVVGIQALAFVATPKDIYFVEATTSKRLLKYSLQTKKTSVVNKAKITSLNVAEGRIIAKSGEKIVENIKLESPVPSPEQQIIALGQQMINDPSDFTEKYSSLQKLRRLVDENKLAMSTTLLLQKIDAMHKQYQSFSQHNIWKARTINDSKKSWTVTLSGVLKNNASNMSKVKVINANGTQLQIDVTINGGQITVTPKSLYDQGGVYFLVINKGLQNDKNQLTKRGTVMQFTFE